MRIIFISTRSAILIFSANFRGFCQVPKRHLHAYARPVHGAGMGVDLDEAILRLLEANESQRSGGAAAAAHGGGPHAEPVHALAAPQAAVDPEGGRRYQRVEPTAAAEPSRSVRVLEAPPNMLVLKTSPGYAQVVAVMVDRAPDIPGLAGTMAGDDTIFIAVRIRRCWPRCASRWSGCCGWCLEREKAPSLGEEGWGRGAAQQGGELRGLPCLLVAGVVHITLPKVSPSAPASAWIVSPGTNSPPSTFSASGSCRYFWIARFSGRAP